MGGLISKAAVGAGGVLADAFTTPLGALLGASCEEVCVGPWDVLCFMDHLCLSSLLKLFMMLTLCYFILLFFYLLFKLRICQCIARKFCKICCAACHSSFSAFQYLWHKLKNTTRVYRGRRFHKIQKPYSTLASTDHHQISMDRKRKSTPTSSTIHCHYQHNERPEISTRHHHEMPSCRDISAHHAHGTASCREISTHHHHHGTTSSREISTHHHHGTPSSREISAHHHHHGTPSSREISAHRHHHGTPSSREISAHIKGRLKAEGHLERSKRRRIG